LTVKIFKVSKGFIYGVYQLGADIFVLDLNTNVLVLCVRISCYSKSDNRILLFQFRPGDKKWTVQIKFSFFNLSSSKSKSSVLNPMIPIKITKFCYANENNNKFDILVLYAHFRSLFDWHKKVIVAGTIGSSKRYVWRLVE
jgi:hypothetical protein